MRLGWRGQHRDGDHKSGKQRRWFESSAWKAPKPPHPFFVATVQPHLPGISDFIRIAILPSEKATQFEPQVSHHHFHILL
jgi:hypothetical protein